MKNQIIIKKLGVGIRALRKIRGVKVAVLAKKLGFDSVEAYLKIERGERKEIGIVQLLIICEELDCSLSNLFIMSGLTLSLFKNNIQTWDQFYESLNNLTDDRKEKVKEILSTLKNVENSK